MPNSKQMPKRKPSESAPSFKNRSPKTDKLAKQKNHRPKLSLKQRPMIRLPLGQRLHPDQIKRRRSQRRAAHRLRSVPLLEPQPGPARLSRKQRPPVSTKRKASPTQRTGFTPGTGAFTTALARAVSKRIALVAGESTTTTENVGGAAKVCSSLRMSYLRDDLLISQTLANGSGRVRQCRLRLFFSEGGLQLRQLQPEPSLMPAAAAAEVRVLPFTSSFLSRTTC